MGEEVHDWKGYRNRSAGDHLDRRSHALPDSDTLPPVNDPLLVLTREKLAHLHHVIGRLKQVENEASKRQEEVLLPHVQQEAIYETANALNASIAARYWLEAEAKQYVRANALPKETEAAVTEEAAELGEWMQVEFGIEERRHHDVHLTKRGRGLNRISSVPQKTIAVRYTGSSGTTVGTGGIAHQLWFSESPRAPVVESFVRVASELRLRIAKLEEVLRKAGRAL